MSDEQTNGRKNADPLTEDQLIEFGRAAVEAIEQGAGYEALAEGFGMTVAQARNNVQWIRAAAKEQGLTEEDAPILKRMSVPGGRGGAKGRDKAAVLAGLGFTG